jgi:hypothetical protein
VTDIELSSRIQEVEHLTPALLTHVDLIEPEVQ